MSQRHFRLSVVLLIVAYLALWGRQSEHMADDPGLGWHLRTGAFVLKEGSVPRIDPFLALPRSEAAATSSPRQWVADQWLSDTVLQSLYSWGSWPLVYAVTIGLFTVAFWGVVLTTAYSASGSALSSLVATALAWKVAQVHLIVRPVLASIVLFAVIAGRVRRLAVQSPTSKADAIREGLVMCSLFALWANLHPAFVLGLAIIALHGAVLLLTRRQLKFACGSLVVLLVCCALATLLNPYGWRVYDSFFDLSASPYLRSINQEWRPLELLSNEALLLLLVTFVPLAFTLSASLRHIGPRLFDILSTLVFTYAAFRMVRFVPYAAILGAPLTAIALADLRRVRLPSVCGATRRFISALEKRLDMPRSPILIASLIAFIGCTLAMVGILPCSGKPIGPSATLYPADMFDEIARDRGEGVILASPDYGGAVAWRLQPGFRAVLDDRNNVVGEELYRRYFRALEDRTELEELVREYGVTHLILSSMSPVVAQLSGEQNWTILYQDSSRRVYRVPTN